MMSKLKNTQLRKPIDTKGREEKDNNVTLTTTPDIEKLYGLDSPTRLPFSNFAELKRDQSESGVKPESPINFVSYSPRKTPKSSKRYNGQVCCFCKDSLQLTLPGEVILPLLCEHLCHKNCFIMLIDSNKRILPTCDICKAQTNVVDEDLLLGMVNAAPMADINESISSEDEVDSPMGAPLLLRDVSKVLVSTPTEQMVNDQLNTPPTSAHGIDYEPLLYYPNITCSSEMHPIKLNESHEISYVLNIKPPSIYNDSSPSFNPSDLKLKWEVSNYISQQLGLSKELGELILFDKMRISIDGEMWDESCLYLFSKFLLIYNGEALAGMISITNDLCLTSLIEGVLNLNLTESTLPELYIYNEFSQTITEKWEFVLGKLMDSQLPITNLFQFTSTCWLDLQYDIDVPLNLIRFNNLLLHGGDLPSFYMTKVLPSPKPLALNIVIAVPLFNKTKLSNTDYRHWLQKLLRAMRSTLSDSDKMGLIFLGIDYLRKAKAAGTFVGCVAASWDGWDNLIDDICIVPNTFSSNSQELNVALEKCAELYPFIAYKESSINKVLVLNCGDYHGETLSQFDFDTQRLLKMSVSLLRVGSHLNMFKEISSFSRYEYGNDPEIRFATPEKLSASITTLMKRMQSICLPYLSVEIEVENNITVSSIELFGVMELKESKSQRIVFRDMGPSDERNLLITMKVTDTDFEFEKIPIFNYTATWRDNKSIEKTVFAQIDQRSLQEPMESDAAKLLEAIVSGSPEKNHPHSIYYLDIPLLPPLSPSRNASFAKRQAELLIIRHLRQAIEEKNATALKACISVAYGLLRCIPANLDADDTPKGAVVDPEDCILNLMAVTKSARMDNQRYVDILVGQLERIISLFDNEPSEALDKCFDLVYSLV